MKEKGKNIMVSLKEIEVDEILRREITDFGSGSHAVLPKKHKGKNAIVVVEKLKSNSNVKAKINK